MSQYHWNRIPDGVMHHVRTQAKRQGITMREYLIELVRGDMRTPVTTARVDDITRPISIGEPIMYGRED